MIDLVKPAQGTKNWHEEVNANFELIEQELNDIEVAQFDQDLNTDDDVTFGSVTAENLKIGQWNTAADRAVTGVNLSGDTLQVQRSDASTLSVNIGGAAGAIPSGFKHDVIEIGSYPGSGESISHELGVVPWGVNVWAILQVSRGGWSVGDRIFMLSHFESGGNNYGFIIRADEDSFSFTSRNNAVLFLSDKDGTSNRNSFNDTEVSYEVYLWAWDVGD